MHSNCLEIIFELNQISALEMWDLLIKHADIVDGKVEFNDGVYYDSSKIESIIKKRHLDYFIIDGEKFETRFSVVGRYKHVLFSISSKEHVELKDWCNLINEIYSFKPFIQAMLVDCEYDHWQTAHDVIQYDAYNRSYEGLPMKSNDLPFPLEQMIIDTSKNPGRRILKDGYVEFVSSHMWVSEHFLELMPVNKEKKISELNDNFKVVEANGLLFIKLSNELYTEEKNNPESLNKLREIIYS